MNPQSHVLSQNLPHNSHEIACQAYGSVKNFVCFVIHYTFRELRRILEEGVDVLETAVGFDGFGALWIGADKLLEDCTSHRGLL